MSNTPKIIAEYYNIAASVKRENPGKRGVLQVFRLGGSIVPREILTTFLVEGKVHARRLALAYDATPWNF